MRDNGKFQDSLLSLCVCNCVWTHRISCPGAFGKQTDNIQEKKFLTVMKFVHFCVGMKMDNHEKQQWGLFFWSCFEGFADSFAKFKYLIHVLLLMSLSVFFPLFVFFRWTVCRWRVRRIQMSLLPLKPAGTRPGCWWWTPKQTPSSRGAGSPPPLSTWLVRARFHAHCEALQVVQKGWSKWVNLAALSDMLWTQAFSFRLPKQAAH